ncbi:NADH-quinone oxidoreductase subunit B [Pseudovibrio sp. Tun.PSC04-5.I4]|uniref:NADH-quinone oxidoreductase subunit B family protein n=1 Tax=Pseudovibrio sp. Tun.PSC04-5.I4 TaxID=1798213 RepID=UPI00088064EA|nr:NADH-quinone oxidoreductase subunit B [Pseudovibrio sp. Tun.PSC04-5.I4]SDQ12186.1 Ni,Fe-hydrogenase III small subunit [Pseudovibrio sp. Tun.PSC04-5.I4]
MLKNLLPSAARSPWLYRINAGSCNGCDVELATTALIPRYDVERLGCKYCGSPKHADIVLITGLMTRPLYDKVMRLYAEVPEPKVTVAVGICPVTGCVFADSYHVVGPVDKHIPIDINILGCPPRPQAIVSGLADAIELWKERI